MTYDEAKQEELEPLKEKLNPYMGLAKLLASYDGRRTLGAGSADEVAIALGLAALDRAVPQIDVKELAGHLNFDMRQLAGMLTDELDRRAQNPNQVPFVTTWSEWYFDKDDFVEETNDISGYLQVEGWKPEFCSPMDEKLDFDGTLEMSDEERADLKESGDSATLVYQKDGSFLKLSVNPSDSKLTVYLTDHYPGFIQGVENLEKTTYLGPRTEKRLLGIMKMIEKNGKKSDSDDPYTMEDIILFETTDWFGHGTLDNNENDPDDSEE